MTEIIVLDEKCQMNNSTCNNPATHIDGEFNYICQSCINHLILTCGVKTTFTKIADLQPRFKAYLKSSSTPNLTGFMVFISDMKRKYLLSINSDSDSDRILDHDAFTRFINDQTRG